MKHPLCKLGLHKFYHYYIHEGKYCGDKCRNKLDMNCSGFFCAKELINKEEILLTQCGRKNCYVQNNYVHDCIRKTRIDVAPKEILEMLRHFDGSLFIDNISIAILLKVRLGLKNIKVAEEIVDRLFEKQLISIDKYRKLRVTNES